jgi:hypothetical protein
MKDMKMKYDPIVPMQEPGIIHTFAEERMTYYRYQFVKTYLYMVFTNNIRSNFFHVFRLYSRETDPKDRFKSLAIGDGYAGSRSDQKTPFPSAVLDLNIEATVLFENHPYELIIFCRKEYGSCYTYFISALGTTKASKSPKACIAALTREALAHSPLKNKTLNILPNHGQDDFDESIEIVNIESTNLDDIFIHRDIRSSLDFFVEAVKYYSKVRLPLRFLLNGKPGTGKTKIIRAIANEVSGCATFIMNGGSDNLITSIYSLANCFTPAVVCIDDIDLLVGNRDDRTSTDSLGKFLQQLDGFLESGVFLLATTNDKTLVDLAASRPGRFDMILDIPTLNPDSMMDFIRTKTASENLLSLFDGEVLDMLRSRKVSGAFLHTLVKQLIVEEGIGRMRLDRAALLSAINRLYDGFYRKPSAQIERIGFMKDN